MDREELIDPIEERLSIEIAAEGGGERVEDREGGGGGGGSEGVVGGKVGRRADNKLLAGRWFPADAPMQGGTLVPLTSLPVFALKHRPY